MKPELVQELRRLRFVPRWAIVPTIRDQNVAEHSFHVTWLTVVVADWIGVPITADLLLDALIHDHEEAITGDTPSTSKKQHAEDAPLEKCIIKVADCLEAWLYMEEERQMGNTCVRKISYDIEDKAEEWVQRINQLSDGHFHFSTLSENVQRLTRLNKHPAMRNAK